MSTASVQAFAAPATSWANLTDDQQLDVTRAALHTAIQIIAGQADMLAEEMEDGVLLDRGGPDALRLLAAALRASTADQVAAPAPRPAPGLTAGPTPGPTPCIASLDLGSMRPMGQA